DSVVRSKSRPVDHGGPDELLVDSPPVAMLRQVAFRQRELLHELCLQRISEELLRELHGARGELDDLHGFDARKLIEKPAAARVHEHGMALELEQFKHRGFVSVGQRSKSVAVKETFRIFR